MPKALAAPEKVDCSKMDEVLDDLGGAQGLTSLNDKYKLATSADEMKKRCGEMEEAIKQLKKYNSACYSSLTQQVFSAILRTRSAMNEARCKDTESKEFKEVVEASKCANDNALESIREAERKTILSSQVLYDANIPDEKLRLKRACCAVLGSKTLFMDAIKAKCSKYETIYAEYVDSYTSEAMSLICPAEDKLECNKLEPLKLEGVATKSKFFLLPMLKLVKTLDH